jgi:hypothetical protein
MHAACPGYLKGLYLVTLKISGEKIMRMLTQNIQRGNIAAMMEE